MALDHTPYRHPPRRESDEVHYSARLTQTFRTSLDQVAREREVILTSNDKPIAILSAVSEETLDESLAAVRRARAVAAVEKMQRQSIQMGTDSLTSSDIAAEIKAVWKARRR